MSLTYQFETHVDAPPTRAFEVFSNFEHAAEHVSGITKMEMLTPGPIGKGTRFKETRMMFNREATEEMEVTEFKPGELFTLGCDSCGMRWQSTTRFESSGSGTAVRMEMECVPQTFFAKLMSPIGKLFAGSMKKCIEGDLHDLKRVAEA